MRLRYSDTVNLSIVNAVWFVIRHYSSRLTVPPINVRDEKLAMGLIDTTVKTRVIGARSELAKAIANCGGVLSRKFVQSLVDLPSQLTMSRKLASDSIESILDL